MPLTKTWAGTTPDYTDVANWQPISIRDAAYKWTASGSGTSEYYLELAAGGDPGLTAPATVQEGGAEMSPGTAGSLLAGEWDFGDNDALGYSTVYVRLADGADPDTKDVDHVTFRQAPVAGDAVVIPASSSQAIDGVDQLGVALGRFVVEEGYNQSIGSAAAPLRITPTSYDFGGSGVAYLNFGAANISGTVRRTASAATGTCGLYLTGSNLNVLTVISGVVGVAFSPGTTSTVATVRTVGQGATVLLGAGCTNTDISVAKGNLVTSAAYTTALVYGGTLRTEGTGAGGTATVEGGVFVSNSSGTLTNCTVSGSGQADFTQSGLPRTVTNLKQNPGGTVSYDPDVLTITNRLAPDSPVRISSASA